MSGAPEKSEKAASDLRALADFWSSLGPKFMPFADAASDALPFSRLMRLSLFQVTVGVAFVMLSGTLNRVMIVELGLSAWLVSLMVALPLLFAPARALIGYKSDTHKSYLGWRRTPYLWFGSLLQFGGFAIMPFALILLSGDTTGPEWIGPAGAAIAFLMVGAGMHTVQTAGLALATDIAPKETRPRVVALLYVMLMVGMVASSVVIGLLLENFSQLRLIQIVQGAAVVTLVLNVVALWQQEPRRKDLTAHDLKRPSFREAWAALSENTGAVRLFAAVALGAAAFNMQDVLLEPYGGEILKLGVGQTTQLTALFALGSLAGFALAARALGRGADPHRLAAFGVLAGLPAFSMVIFAGPLESAMLFRAGAALIGFGAGLFGVATLAAAMNLASTRATLGGSGLALGAGGAVQATAAGGAIALGGALRDGVQSLAATGALGAAFDQPAIGYNVVYHLEILLLFITLIVLAPLVRFENSPPRGRTRFGMADFPT